MKFLSLILACFLVWSLQGDEEIQRLSHSLTQSLDLEEKPTYQHFIKSTDATSIVLNDDAHILIDWWYRSTSKNWKQGDQVYITFDFSYKKIKIKHAVTSEIVWGSLQDFPSSIPIIRSVFNGADEPEPYSKIELSNGCVFQSCKKREFGTARWKEKDSIIILANPDGLYQLWNIERGTVVLSELVKSQMQQTHRQRVEIQDIWGLEDRLNARVFQQPEATKAVVDALFNYAAGLNDKEHPVGVFLFIGPTGVGKTELAKALVDEFYHDSSRLVRFDMSHFTEPHSLSRLIGSQLGYVNHEEGGQLTNPLLENPQVVVLLDEIEKADPQVRKVFLPIFDEGFVLDTKNHHVSCVDTIFIMTSNLCAQQIAQLHKEGYDSEQILAAIEPQLMQALSPELYNRVEPVLFEPLARETMEALVGLMLEKLAKKVITEKGASLHIDDSLLRFLEEKGYHPLLGARPLKKLIEKRVVSTLAHHIVKEGVEEGDELFLSYQPETDSVSVAKKEIDL